MNKWQAREYDLRRELWERHHHPKVKANTLVAKESSYTSHRNSSDLGKYFARCFDQSGAILDFIWGEEARARKSS